MLRSVGVAVVGRVVQRRFCWVLLVSVLIGAACGQESVQQSSLMPSANPQRGEDLIRSYGCVACHAIPGIAGADSYVGPPLTRWPERNYIAGQFVNSPANLIAWLQDPQGMAPGSAMPTLKVTEQDARDMAAYLYQLPGDPVEWLDRDLPIGEGH